MTTEYETAYTKHNEAIRVYEVVRNAYRARKIGDAEFIAARKVYDAATAEFDAAYSKAAGWTA